VADELSLYGALLGERGGRLGRLLEGMMTAQVTSVLARLGVPDELAGGPLTVDQLAPRVGAAPDALGRLLAAAAAYGLVSQDSQGNFALTEDGELLRTDVDGSARALAIGFFGPPIWANFGRTADVVRNPAPVNPAEPGGVFEYYAAHPEDAVWFAQGMGRATTILVAQLAKAGFRPLTGGRIVDVGGGRGTLLAYLLQAVPGATGVLLDRPEALAAAPGYLAGAGVADRVELVPGDFLREVPGGDLHVICHTLHNWDDEHAQAIVGNCARASRPGGGLMVIDQVLPDGPEPSEAHLMDLIMMLAVGGRERTRAEHEALLGSVGYTLVRETPVTEVLPWRVLEFERP
jgi:SAM-dependent methyltransferase